MSRNLRRFLVRILALGLFILGGYLLADWGRGHVLLVDNKTLGELQAPAVVEVSFNGENPVEVARLERIKKEVSGQRHRIKAVVVAGQGLGKEVSADFVLEGSGMKLISIPALLAGGPQDSWLTEFVPPTTAPARDSAVLSAP